MSHEIDPKKTPEEIEQEEKERQVQEVMKLLEELDEKDKKMSQSKTKNITLVLGFLLHPNKAIHLLLTFLLSLVVALSILGYAPFAYYEDFSVLLVVIFVFVWMEFGVKTVVLKYFAQAVLYSLGTIFYVFQLLSFYAIDTVFGTVFGFTTLDNLLLFVTIFALMRLIASVYLRKYMFRFALKRKLKR